MILTSLQDGSGRKQRPVFFGRFWHPSPFMYLPAPLPDHLDVTLALPAKEPKVAPKPRPVKHHRVKPHLAKPKTPQTPPPMPKVADAQPAPAPAPQPETPAVPPIQPATPEPEVPDPATPEPDVPDPEPPAPPPKPALSNPLPKDAQIEYALIKGENGLKVGRVTMTLKILGNNYTLSSVTEATGIFSLIKSGRLVETSQGKITDTGLRPDLFWIQRGQSVDTTESATFNWETKSLSLSSREEQRAYTLPEESEDLLSFPYQLALLAKNNLPLKLAITNGRKLDNYEYRIVGTETLSTASGTIQALHLEKIRQPGEDGTDIWFSLDQNYLPVKIRVTDKNGGIAEQIAVNITGP